MSRIWEGTYAAMVGTTNAPVGTEWTVTSGASAGIYKYYGATFGWVQTHDASGAARVALASGGAIDATGGTLPLGTEVAVTEALTKIAELTLSGNAFIEIAVADNALDQFQIRAKAPSGSEQILYSTTPDFTSIEFGILVGCSGDLTTQGVGSGWLILEATGTIILYAASGNAAGSGVTVYG